jgi:hypothetical protein
MNNNSKLPEWKDATSTVLSVDGGLPLFSRVCNYCQNLISTSDRTCAAFIEGIPDEIWRGENDHTTSYPGDRGIMWKFVEKE